MTDWLMVDSLRGFSCIPWLRQRSFKPGGGISHLQQRSTQGARSLKMGKVLGPMTSDFYVAGNSRCFPNSFNVSCIWCGTACDRDYHDLSLDVDLRMFCRFIVTHVLQKKKNTWTSYLVQYLSLFVWQQLRKTPKMVSCCPYQTDLVLYLGFSPFNYFCTVLTLFMHFMSQHVSAWPAM